MVNTHSGQEFKPSASHHSWSFSSPAHIISSSAHLAPCPSSVLPSDYPTRPSPVFYTVNTHSSQESKYSASPAHRFWSFSSPAHITSSSAHLAPCPSSVLPSDYPTRPSPVFYTVNTHSSHESKSSASPARRFWSLSSPAHTCALVLRVSYPLSFACPALSRQSFPLPSFLL
jgi:hypothetical protein